MGIFDKLKGLGEQVGNYIKDKIEDEPPVMKICMLGAKGVGKTSVLTSMYRDMNSATTGSLLHMSALGDTQAILSTKETALKRMFPVGNRAGEELSFGGIAGDQAETIFDFEFGMKNKKVNISLQVKDYPGEYLVNQKDTVKKYIEESQAIVLAIDTPHLIECNSQYSEKRNLINDITSFFEDILRNNPPETEKLVLFVPLKCEKYYYEGRMDEINEAIEKQYSKLIALLKDKENNHNLKGKFACVITPILTVGEVVFKDFKRDSSGNVLEEASLPQESIYVYKNACAKFSPVYCEQPLCYLLSFVSKMYIRSKENPNKFFGKLMNIFRLSPPDPDLLLEIQNIAEKKQTDEEGFKIICGRGLV